jgi:hypothetical protein
MTITASLSCHLKGNKEPSDTPCLLNVLSWRPVVLSRLGVHFIAFSSFHSAGNVSFFSSKKDRSQWLLTLRISGNQGHHVILSPDNVSLSLERQACRPRRHYDRRGRVCLFLGTCVQMLLITKMRRRSRFLDDGIVVFTLVVVTRAFLDSRNGNFHFLARTTCTPLSFSKTTNGSNNIKHTLRDPFTGSNFSLNASESASNGCNYFKFSPSLLSLSEADRQRDASH